MYMQIIKHLCTVICIYAHDCEFRLHTNLRNKCVMIYTVYTTYKIHAYTVYNAYVRNNVYVRVCVCVCVCVCNCLFLNL